MINILHYTYIEAIRSKVFFISLFFGIVLLFLSRAISALSFTGQETMLFDFTMAGLNIVAVFLSIFLGTFLFHKELAANSLLLNLSKPLHRWQFLLGKFLGYLCSIFAVLISILIFISLFFYMQDIALDTKFLFSIFGIFLDATVSLSFVFLFSVISPSFLSLVLSFCFWLICQSHEGLKYLMENTQDRFVNGVFFIVNLISPNFAIWNWKDRPEDFHFVFSEWSTQGLYALFWAIFYLLLASIIFRKKDCV